jgi:hypothetical protein
MTYSINGKQYPVVCEVGHGKAMGDSVAAFTLRRPAGEGALGN